MYREKKDKVDVMIELIDECFKSAEEEAKLKEIDPIYSKTEKDLQIAEYARLLASRNIFKAFIYNKELNKVFKLKAIRILTEENESLREELNKIYMSTNENVAVDKSQIEVAREVRKNNYLDRLGENQEQIKKLILKNKKISIQEIAKELGMTRQALYKNKDLKKFIDELKKSVN